MIASANLDESPLPSAVYNNLPHIDDMKNAGSGHPEAMGALLGLIAAHAVQDLFSFHLVRKHFDIPEGRVMVYETIASNRYPAFQISTPRDPAKCRNLRGLYFRATDEGKMAAYCCNVVDRYSGH